jgi:pimeloyl-ACP methyl ester carboxylesterase
MDRVPLRGLLDSLSTIVSHDSRAILPTIEIPTLVLVGSIDEETPPAYGQAIVDLMPNARLCVIDDAGHLLNLEAAEAVSIEIAGHWQEERHWQEEQRTENP